MHNSLAFYLGSILFRELETKFISLSNKESWMESITGSVEHKGAKNGVELVSSTSSEANVLGPLDELSLEQRRSGVLRNIATGVATAMVGLNAVLSVGCDEKSSGASTTDSTLAVSGLEPGTNRTLENEYFPDVQRDTNIHGPSSRHLVIQEHTPTLLGPGSSSDALPFSLSPARIHTVDPDTGEECRRINIYREDPNHSAAQDTAPARHRHYYHYPFGGWIVSKSNGLMSQPSIIHNISELKPDGTYTVKLKFSTTSPEIRELAKQAVLKYDREYALQGDIKDVVIHPWPFTHSVWLFNSPSTGRTIGIAVTEVLESASTIELYTQVSANDLQEFIERTQDGSLRATPYFQARGQGSIAVNVEIRGNREVIQSVTANLSSEQLTGRSPIFQNEVQKVMQEVRESYTRTVRAQHPDLISQIDSSPLMARLFQSSQEYSLDQLMSEFDGAADKFNAFIRPHLETFQREMARHNVQIDITETAKTKGKSGGGGFSVLGIGASSSWGSSESDLKRLEEVTGVTFQSSHGGTRFTPHSIKVSKLKEGWQNVSLDVQDSLFVSIGREHRYVPDTPIPANLTTQRARDSIGIARAGFGGVNEILDALKQAEADRDTYKNQRDAEKTKGSRYRRQRNQARTDRDQYKKDYEDARRLLRRFGVRI